LFKKKVLKKFRNKSILAQKELVKKVNLEKIPNFGLGNIYEHVIGECIGRGSTSGIYLMRDIIAKQLVAVKAISLLNINEIIELLENEMEIHAMLGQRHHNIVSAYEC